MKGIRQILAKIFPVPAPGQKLSPGERVLLGGIIVATLAAVVYFVADWPSGFYWGNYSLFRHLGFYCPACGGSRSIYYLVRGNLSLAWQNNQLFVLSLPLILWAGFTVLRSVLTGYPITGKYLRPRLIWGYFTVIILFGILRNIPWGFLDCLRPPA